MSNIGMCQVPGCPGTLGRSPHTDWGYVCQRCGTVHYRHSGEPVTGIVDDKMCRLVLHLTWEPDKRFELQILPKTEEITKLKCPVCKFFGEGISIPPQLMPCQDVIGCSNCGAVIYRTTNRPLTVENKVAFYEAEMISWRQVYRIPSVSVVDQIPIDKKWPQGITSP